MRFNLLLGTALSLATLVFSAQGSCPIAFTPRFIQLYVYTVVLEEDDSPIDQPNSTEPVVASAAFAESNLFGRALHHIAGGDN